MLSCGGDRRPISFFSTRNVLITFPDRFLPHQGVFVWGKILGIDLPCFVGIKQDERLGIFGGDRLAQYSSKLSPITMEPRFKSAYRAIADLV